MAYLLSFDPEKTFGDNNQTEKHLFEAFWILVKGVPASGENLESAVAAKQIIKRASVEGGSLIFANCPLCTQRWMQHQKIQRTIDSKTDLLFESDEFEFVKSCLPQWRTVTLELEEAFVEIAKRLKTATPITMDQYRTRAR